MPDRYANPRIDHPLPAGHAVEGVVRADWTKIL